MMVCVTGPLENGLYKILKAHFVCTSGLVVEGPFYQSVKSDGTPVERAH